MKRRTILKLVSNSDISLYKNVNIFEIVSSRYIRSGMRHLLEPEQLIPAERGHESDISK